LTEEMFWQAFNSAYKFCNFEILEYFAQCKRSSDSKSSGSTKLETVGLVLDDDTPCQPDAVP